MAIDPIAVTGGAAANMPTNTDVPAQSNAAVSDGTRSSQSSVSVGSSASIDLANYANQQNSRALPLEALSADGKAQYFANPTTLGEEVLSYLEGFHERVVDHEPLSARFESSKSEQWVDTTSTGPASATPSASQFSADGSTTSDQISPAEARFELVLEIMQEAGFRHTETNLVSGVGQQFSKAMSTLMRGQ